MKLDEFVKLQDDKTIIAIGASSGFVFIGTKAQYEDEIDKAYKRAQTNARDLLRDAENRIEALRRDGFDDVNAHINIPESDEELPEAFKQMRATADNLIRKAQLLRSYVDKFDSAVRSRKRAQFTLSAPAYRDREVKESYRAIRQGQINVIIEGVECGRYWTLEANEEDRG